MGQKVARPEIGDGVKLYNALKFTEAITKWTKALEKSCNPREKFVILGYLITASFDRGKYRDMLTYSAQQIDIAHQLDDVELRAEAYLNLARSNESVSEYHKTLAYCRHCLSNETEDDRISGNVYLSMAGAYRGLGQYLQAAQNYEISLKLAKKCKDTLLECQLNSGLGHMFVTLRDYDKALFYHLRAAGLARQLESCDIPGKFKRLTCFNLAIPNRKLGRLKDAMDYCEDAMKAGMTNEDRDLQAKCLCMFADIHRKRGQIQRALPRYESAYAITIETGDQITQLDVLAGMAKACIAEKDFQKALELNCKGLETAENLANKSALLLCHLRFEEVYRLQGEHQLAEQHMAKRQEITQDVAIKCPYCNDVIGESSAKLDLISCGHIFHQTCWKKIKQKRSVTSSLTVSSRMCPVCQPTLPNDDNEES